MDFLLLYYILSVYLTIAGLSHGSGVLPDFINGPVGGSVMFTTTLNPPETQHVVVQWNVRVNGNRITIITSTTSDIIAPGYEDRITLDRSTGSLELRNLALNDSGEYSLAVTPAGGQLITGDCQLKIYVPVSNVVVTHKTTDLVEFNSSVSLSCSSFGSSLSYRWLNGSSEVTASDGGSTLTLVNVTRYDQGPFTCLVSNPISHNYSDPVQLSISFGPENTNLKICPSKEVHEGSDVSLFCSASSRPPALFHWVLNGTLLSEAGPELRLKNIQTNQSGSYSCQAYNSKTLRSQTSLPSVMTVLERITDASIKTSTNLPVEGHQFNLTCNAAGSNIIRQWMKDGQPLSSDNNIIVDNTVVSFNPVMKKDSGEYLCNVSNPVSFQEAKYNMIVNFGPDNVKIMGPVEIEVDNTLTLKCNAESIPTAIYTWMLNGTKLVGNSAEFTKKVTQFSDSGDYTCQAENIVTGNKTMSPLHGLTVKEKGALNGPDSLSAGAIAGITIASLTLLGGLVGGGGYYMYKNGKLDGIKAFKKNSSNGNTSSTPSSAAAGYDNRAGAGNQELNYAAISHFQKRDGGIVQLGDQGAPSTVYSQVQGRAAGSSLPSYNAHLQKTKSSAPQPAGQPGETQPASSVYAQVRKP